MKIKPNVKLRALKEADIWILHQWVNDPELVKYTYFFHPVSELEHKEWFNSLPQKKNNVIFGIEITEGNRLIGTCGFNDIHPVCRKAELFIKICDPTLWGKGIGKDVLELLVDFGISDLNLRRIFLRVLSDNERAIQLYQKFGFVTEGVLKEDHYIQGEYKDVIVMAKIKS